MQRIDLGTYEELQRSLRVRLMDAKANKELLRKLVYEPVGCGYALAAYIAIPAEVSKKGIANVPRELVEASGFTVRQIMLDARVGSVTADAPRLSPVRDLLYEKEPKNLLAGGEVGEEDLLLALTTEKGILGAAALYYPEMTKRVSEIVGGDYYVIPSSVHEVLILPDKGNISPMELAKMVMDINKEQVSPPERLGNRVLHYRADIDKLQVAADLDKVKERGREKE